MLKRLLWGVLLLPLLLAASNRLESVTMGPDRLELHFAQPFDATSVRQMLLKGRSTYRYVFDLHGVQLGRKILKAPLAHSRAVKSFRIAQFRPSVVRVVVETPKAYKPRHYALSPKRYAITLPPGTSKTPSVKGLFAGLKNKGSKASKPSSSGSKPSKSAAKSAKSSRSGARLMSQSTPHLKRRYRIILDPGHGGHDSGALDPTRRYREKRIVLQIARRLRTHLKKMGFDVVMTRSSDRFIKLHRRTRYANLKHGDVFVSIHANAVGRRSRASKVQGVETYFLSPARSARARRVAAKENTIAFKKYYKKSMDTFLRTMTRSKIVLSNKLALDVQRGMLSRVRSRYKSVVDGGVRPAPFWVLVGAEMPAVLVEVGYISHPREKRRLADPRYQELLAKGIAEGIARYLRNRERELE